MQKYACMQPDTPGGLHGIDKLHFVHIIYISSKPLPGFATGHCICQSCLISLVFICHRKHQCQRQSTKTSIQTTHAFYTAAYLQHAVQTCQNTNTCALALLQAKYHGIALTVNPDKLTPVNGKPLQQAIETVLHNPIFKVWHLKQIP